MRATIRRRIKDALANQCADRRAVARSLATQLFTIPEVMSAKTVMAYIDLPDELPVSNIISDLFFRPGTLESLSPVPVRDVVIPFCQGNEIGLYRFSKPNSPDETISILTQELQRGQFGILEPCLDLRNEPCHMVHPSEIDLVLIPGLAFDLQGGRLGRGAGYYDRFISLISPKIPLIALALDVQLVNAVPMEEHDRRIDYIVKIDTIHKIR